MGLPNLISLGRLIMAPLFALLYLRGYTAAALCVLCLAAASDVLDGALARRLNAVTELGKVLDPVADKLMQAAMMLCAAYLTPAVWLLLAVHAARELSLGAMGLYVLRVTGRVYSAKWYGKLCSAAIYSVLAAALAFPSLPERLIRGGVLLCAALAACCLALYMAQYLRILRHSEIN